MDINGKPCAVCAGRGFARPNRAPRVTQGATEDFFQGASRSGGVPTARRCRQKAVRQDPIMPGKLFERDGRIIRSVLKLTASEAKGFFDVETLGGVASVFVDAGAKTRRRDGAGAGLPAFGARRAERAERGPRRARGGGGGDVSNVKRQTRDGRGRWLVRTRRLPDEEIERGEDVDGATRAPKVGGATAAPDATDLAALLAAKKRALIAALEAKAAEGAGRVNGARGIRSRARVSRASAESNPTLSVYRPNQPFFSLFLFPSTNLCAMIFTTDAGIEFATRMDDADMAVEGGAVVVTNVERPTSWRRARNQKPGLRRNVS